MSLANIPKGYTSLRKPQKVSWQPGLWVESQSWGQESRAPHQAARSLASGPQLLQAKRGMRCLCIKTSENSNVRRVHTQTRRIPKPRKRTCNLSIVLKRHAEPSFEKHHQSTKLRTDWQPRSRLAEPRGPIMHMLHSRGPPFFGACHLL